MKLEKDFYTRTEAAKILNMNCRSVSNAIYSGRLQAIEGKMGAMLIARDELLRYIDTTKPEILDTELINTAEASRILGLRSAGTIKTYARKNLLPSIKVHSRKLLFRKSDVLDFKKRFRHQTVEKTTQGRSSYITKAAEQYPSDDVVNEHGATICWTTLGEKRLYAGYKSVEIECICGLVKLVPASRVKNITGLCGSCVQILHPKGGSHHAWKGGRRREKSGYVLIHIENFSDEERKIIAPMIKRGGPYVSEHRAVMALHLGRSLQSDEIVNHINHIKDDNRLENLELTTSEHHRQEEAKWYQIAMYYKKLYEQSLT